MSGIFEPARRQLTEEQFAKTINGKKLNNTEIQILRRACGLPYDEVFVWTLFRAEEVAALAWRKIMGFTGAQ